MVYMRMSQNHCVNFARMKSKRTLIQFFNGSGTLEHTAIHQHFLAADFQHITRTRHSTGRT